MSQTSVPPEEAQPDIESVASSRAIATSVGYSDAWARTKSYGVPRGRTEPKGMPPHTSSQGVSHYGYVNQ